MIKAVMHAEKDGEQVKILLIGLSYTNLDLLQQKRPILVPQGEMADLGLPGVELLVVGDETEDVIMTELEKRFTINKRVTRQ